jgi:hypothetical protein
MGLPADRALSWTLYKFRAGSGQMQVEPVTLRGCPFREYCLSG